jgi:hypothetical protein
LPSTSFCFTAEPSIGRFLIPSLVLPTDYMLTHYLHLWSQEKNKNTLCNIF